MVRVGAIGANLGCPIAAECVGVVKVRKGVITEGVRVAPIYLSINRLFWWYELVSNCIRARCHSFFGKNSSLNAARNADHVEYCGVPF